MRVSGNTSCSGEIDYYCHRCAWVVIYDTKRSAIDEKKSAEHTDNLKRLRAEAALGKALVARQ